MNAAASAAVAALLLSAAACAQEAPTVTEPVTDPEIVAHRGASADAPENTLAAFRLAWEQGADAIEMDVHVSYDGRAMVIHDRDTKRVAGRDMAVATYVAEELRRVDVGSWKGSAFAGERIPFLEEVLATVPNGKRAYVEVKPRGERTVAAVAKAIEQAGNADRFVLISFDEGVIEAFGARIPGVERRWVIDAEWDESNDRAVPIGEAVAHRAADEGIGGLNVNHEGINGPLVAAMRERGLHLSAWTVNDEARAKELAAMGVESITTDRPAFLKQAFKGGDSPAQPDN